MSLTLEWTPNRFWTQKFDASKRHLRRTSAAALAVSAGRTWQIAPDSSPRYLGHTWQAYRFNMGALAAPINFTAIHPDGGSVLSDDVPAVNPVILTCDIA